MRKRKSDPLAKPTKRKRLQPTAAAAPPSIGDSLKDSLRTAQSTKMQAPVDPAVPATSSSWEVDESAPFPRGGGSALTPLEYKTITAAAKADALFEAQEDEDAKAPRAETGADPERTAMSGSDLVRAHVLTRKRIVQGVRLLGAVSDVSSDRLMLQLPGRLTGRVERHEVSDELHAAITSDSLHAPPDLRKLFAVGEVLCCAVISPAPAGIKGQTAPPVELTWRHGELNRETSRLISPRGR